MLRPRSIRQRTPTTRKAQALDKAHSQFTGGHLANAESICRRLLSETPGDPEVLNLLATIKLKQGNYEEALGLLATSLSTSPAQAVAHFNRAYAFASTGRLEEAIDSYDQAIALRPDYFKAHLQRASALVALKRPEEALVAYDLLLQVKPDSWQAHNNRGNLLKRLDRLDGALTNYDEAIRLHPEFPEAHNNRGKVLKDMGRLDEAQASYERAIALRPDYATAQTNKSLLLLLRGELPEGWKLFEWRWQSSRRGKFRQFSQALWLGNRDLRGARLFVWSEQGFGDLIQFSRFIPMLGELGCQVILEVQKSLVPVIRTLASKFEIIENGSDFHGNFDFHCPLMSLPLALGIRLDNLPSNHPYLTVLPERLRKWRQILGLKKSFRIGLAWSGSATHNNDHNRSLALRLLAPLLTLPAEFHVVQKEIREADAVDLVRLPISNHTYAIEDFADTAALIEEMDLVISVDTSVAHLAGALGKEVWVLLPFVPDYRWLLERDDSPWYPTAKLFRQPSIGDWVAPLQILSNKLDSILQVPAGSARSNQRHPLAQL